MSVCVCDRKDCCCVSRCVGDPCDCELNARIAALEAENAAEKKSAIDAMTACRIWQERAEKAEAEVKKIREALEKVLGGLRGLPDRLPERFRQRDP